MPELVPDASREFVFVACADAAEAAGKVVKLVTERLPARFGFDPRRDVQVLCPMNRGESGARALNLALQARLNPGAESKIERFGTAFAVGDKVMQLENDYDRDVYNGDLGVIVRIDHELSEVTVRFDQREVVYEFGELDRLALAYATTIHKAQGSEYNAVVVPITTQHYPMLRRRLLYTAVTRARRLVVLVGQIKAVALAARGARETRRWTKLAERLRSERDAGAGPRKG